MAKKITKEPTTKNSSKKIKEKTKIKNLFGEIVDIGHTEEKEEKLKKNIDIFEFIDMIFDPSININKRFSSYDLAKYYFMLTRFMSIEFPLQASMLSVVGINEANVVRYWVKFLRRKFTYKPNFFYTKTKKEVLVYVPPDAVRIEYCRMHEIDQKTFKEAMRMFPDEMKQELDLIENLQNNYNK